MKILNLTAHAQEIDIQSQVGGGFFAYDCVAQMVTQLVNFALITVGILLLIYLVWSGLQWMISGGDKAKVQDARSRLTHALIGLIIVSIAYAIWLIALNFFGIKGNICAEDFTSSPSSQFQNQQNPSQRLGGPQEN